MGVRQLLLPSISQAAQVLATPQRTVHSPQCTDTTTLFAGQPVNDAFRQVKAGHNNSYQLQASCRLCLTIVLRRSEWPECMAPAG